MGKTHEYCENIRNYIEVSEPYPIENDRYLCSLTGTDCIAKTQKPTSENDGKVHLKIDKGKLNRCPTLDVTDKNLVKLIHQSIKQREARRVSERLEAIQED